MSAATLPVRCVSRSSDRLNSRRPSSPLQWPARAVRDRASETEMWTQASRPALELARGRLVRERAARLARGLRVSVATKPPASSGLNLAPSKPTPSNLTLKREAATRLTRLPARTASPLGSFLGFFPAASFHDGC